MMGGHSWLPVTSISGIVSVLEGGGDVEVAAEDLEMFSHHNLGSLGSALEAAQDGEEGTNGHLAKKFLAVYTRDLPDGYSALD